MNIFKRSTTAADKREKKLTSQVLDLQAELEARDRTIRILQSEVETLAMVLARDRARVQAEAAEQAARRAAAEGGRDG
ncbi:hypothetical protein [Aeoliella sp.]|uniref:hypothetical protein n=1 Tax=Aeoliella sp. TaxID=2795800 RepID=UPI003CCBE6C3